METEEGGEMHRLSASTSALPVSPRPLSLPSSTASRCLSKQLAEPLLTASSATLSSELCNDIIKPQLEGSSGDIVLPLAKAEPKMGRVSPLSVDSGFESSFPSSPDSYSGESRNLLLQKPATSCIRSISLEIVNDISANSRASVIQVAPPASEQSESPDVDPDVVPEEVSHLACTAEVIERNESSFKKPLNVICDEPTDTESAALPVVNCASSSAPHESDVQNVEDYNGNDAATVANVDSVCCANKQPSDSVAAEEPGECPSTSAASSYYAPSTPQSFQDDEDTECYCRWDTCGQQFSNEIGLFDHVIQDHFDCLYPLEEPNPSKRVRGLLKNRQKNLICKWDNCEMGLSRGDLKKQYAWLKEHFLTRHFSKARPYRCLISGCNARFSFKRALEDHLRTGHDKIKRPEVGRKKKPVVKSCLEWTPLPYYPPSPKNDFMDRATQEFMVMRLRQYESIKHPQFVVREPPGGRGGAAYRKRRRILTWDIVPFEKFLKMEMEKKKQELISGVPQVGESAAEEWKKLFAKRGVHID